MGDTHVAEVRVGATGAFEIELDPGDQLSDVLGNLAIIPRRSWPRWNPGFTTPRPMGN